LHSIFHFENIFCEDAIKPKTLNIAAARPVITGVPKRLVFHAVKDSFVALYEWFRAFRKTFSIEPGLYFIGERYDVAAPLLVTGNYHLTVYLLWRVLRNRTVRILVIDTDGINVWCASGKGRFCAREILRQLRRYDRRLITRGERIELVLPKLSLSGVSLSELRKNGVSPRIGPVYRRDIPAYLDTAPLADRATDTYRFDLRDRLFTLLPSLAQFMKFGLFVCAGLFAWDHWFATGIHWQVLPIIAVSIVLYVVLFPLLPSRTFAIKGLSTAGLMIAGMALLASRNGSGIPDASTSAFYALFTAGANLFFALSYTGNSGVSNYSLVKREIVRFLIPTIALGVAALVVIIVKGVMS